jgi:HD-GYP domain-containing protein (c-di-GMP phosphodiesterase class II)
MNTYAVLTLMVSFFLICLGIFICVQGFQAGKDRYKAAFAAGCFCCFIWLSSFAVMYLTSNKPMALLFAKLGMSGAIFTAMTFHHFIVLLLGRKERFFIIFTYIMGTIFAVLVWLPAGFIKGLYEYAWGYYPELRVSNLLSVFLFGFLFARGAVLSFFGYRNKLKQGLASDANRLKYIFWGFVIGPTAGIDYLPGYGFDIYPFGFLIMTIWICIISYAILRYRLMSIEIVIRETAIFAGIFGFSIGLFMLAITAGEQMLLPYLGGNKWIIPAFSLLLVTFAIRPIEKVAYNVVGRYLFRRKFEYQRTLQDAAEGMSKIRDPKRLLNLITHIISAKLKLTGVCIILYDTKQERYRIMASRGNAKEKFVNLSPENPLIAWLSEKKKPLMSDEIRKWAGSKLGRDSLGVLKSDLMQIQERLEDLNAAVCVPCFFREELLGILVLGEKKTGDFFSQDDLNLFSALSDEAAIALKNSQLYFEIDKKANELESLYKREHRLFMHASIAFAAAIDARDSYTHGHSERVTNISLAILDYAGAVEEIDKNPLFRQRLQIAAVLHDVGKIGVPDDILHKPSKLTSAEEKVMQRHPLIGAEIVTHIKGLRDLIGGIKYHHERYDGKGYPEGLKADQIPFMAKIISIADTFDAMTSDRPYRKGLDVMIAREEIQKNAASQFDPYMVAAFLKAFQEGKIK